MATTASNHPSSTPPGQRVLVLQGGGALGAYQLGVYEALHEAGLEPDWVVGTSIGAINGALIAGNAPEHRLERLCAFWDLIAQDGPANPWGQVLSNWGTLTRGIAGFFEPGPASLLGPYAPLGPERAAWYDTAPLRASLERLLDFERLAGGDNTTPRLTVGCVSASRGEMVYFDSRDGALLPEHILASGALPPAFPAVRIDGEPYWDGGIYSNTPLECVLDDQPRRDSTIFSVHLWNPVGPEPQSVWEVGNRQKDIQYASRVDSHLARQQQIHQLRHIIRELGRRLGPEQRRSPEVRALTAWGCGTQMHVLRLMAPRLAGEDQTKDMDFRRASIEQRRQAGLADTRAALAAQPWTAPQDPTEGIHVHDCERHAG
ncbi:patatin-like phospholipase family protein [Roseateles sp. DAIF2]|uniref:patatin-like phospholipase family protein n=1 Tax=Roseateles sp. DAIF2 TaxID=2714952 RepID=UPI0018A31EDF|nr:patatin-like phospholipase family protein [Roseateles sp. DAIF2]QPF73081.1 patatin-like phospholipase family protein [Roseateles sp. DAIF2]